MPSLAKNKSKSLKTKKVALKNGHKNGHKNGIKVSAKTAILKKAGKRMLLLRRRQGRRQKEMKNLLGGKGANLAEMTNIGLPVPAGFTITTEVCTYFYADGKKLPTALDAEVRAAIAQHREGRRRQVRRRRRTRCWSPALGRARVDARHDGHGPQHRPQRRDRRRRWPSKSGNERFAWDSYRRFVQMYGDVVLGMKPETQGRPRSVRGDPATQEEARAACKLDTELDRRRSSRSWSPSSRRRSRSAPARTSPTIRMRAALGRDRRRVRLAG